MEINNLNIPAFQRKRSLAAKARKKTIIPRQKTVQRTTRLTRISKNSRIPINSYMQTKRVSSERLTNKIDEIEEPIEETPSMREMKICGICEGYFEKIEVAVIQVSSPIREGDRLIFETEEGLFEQTAKSIQINRKSVMLAKTGSDIGIKVLMPPTVGTKVYKVI